MDDGLKNSLENKIMSYTPNRIAYPFDLSGVKFKSRIEILRMQQQWETFERVENYNDIIYQRFSAGDRSKTYYQFTNNAEKNDYRLGQQLHINRYPYLPSSTFDPISMRSMPDVAIRNAPPNYTISPMPLAYIPGAIPESITTMNAGDLTIYTYVSTFNGCHVFKYNFISDEERLAYHRGEQIIETARLLSTMM